MCDKSKQVNYKANNFRFIFSIIFAYMRDSLFGSLYALIIYAVYGVGFSSLTVLFERKGGREQFYLQNPTISLWAVFKLQIENILRWSSVKIPLIKVRFTIFAFYNIIFRHISLFIILLFKQKLKRMHHHHNL